MKPLASSSAHGPKACSPALPQSLAPPCPLLFMEGDHAQPPCPKGGSTAQAPVLGHPRGLGAGPMEPLRSRRRSSAQPQPGTSCVVPRTALGSGHEASCPGCRSGNRVGKGEPPPFPAAIAHPAGTSPPARLGSLGKCTQGPWSREGSAPGGGPPRSEGRSRGERGPLSQGRGWNNDKPAKPGEITLCPVGEGNKQLPCQGPQLSCELGPGPSMQHSCARVPRAPGHPQSPSPAGKAATNTP